MKRSSVAFTIARAGLAAWITMSLVACSAAEEEDASGGAAQNVGDDPNEDPKSWAVVQKMTNFEPLVMGAKVRENGDVEIRGTTGESVIALEFANQRIAVKATIGDPEFRIGRRFSAVLPRGTFDAHGGRVPFRYTRKTDRSRPFEGGEVGVTLDGKEVKSLYVTASNLENDVGYGNTDAFEASFSGSLPIEKGGGAPTGDLTLRGNFGFTNLSDVASVVLGTGEGAITIPIDHAKSQSSFERVIPREKLAALGVRGAGGREGLESHLAVSLKEPSGKRHDFVLNFNPFSTDEESAGIAPLRSIEVK
jgi:hypothetical protein